MKITLKLTLALGVVAALAVGAGGCEDQSGRGAAASSSAAAKPAPKIVALAPKFHFGKVKQGQEVEHVYKIRNDGSTPLLIQKAKGS